MRTPLTASRQTGSIAVLALALTLSSAFAADPVKSVPIRIAVFDFELEDTSPAAALLNKSTSSAASMDKVSSEARQELAQSGRYRLIDASKADAKPVMEKSLMPSPYISELGQ